MYDDAQAPKRYTRIVGWGLPSSYLEPVPIITMASVNATVRTTEGFPGAEPDGCPLRADSLHDSIGDIQGKAAAVLNRPAVLVRAFVCHVLDELVD